MNVIKRNVYLLNTSGIRILYYIPDKSDLISFVAPHVRIRFIGNPSVFNMIDNDLHHKQRNP